MDQAQLRAADTVQSPQYNRAVGGVARHLEPLTIDPTPELDSLYKAFGFARDMAFHGKIHQIRVITSKEIHGVAVVEGPHRDGQEWQIIAVFKRHNIIGGESQFLPSGGGAVLCRGAPTGPGRLQRGRGDVAQRDRRLPTR